MSSTQPIPTNAASSCPSGPARADAPAPTAPAQEKTPQKLSPKALAFGALFGAAAAFLFAPDFSTVIAGDDAGIHSFFANEAARRRTPPTQFIRPQQPAPRAAAAARRGEAPAQLYARAPAPNLVRAYAPFDLRAPQLGAAPAFQAIQRATVRKHADAQGRRPSKSVRPLAVAASWSAAATPSSFEPMGKRTVCVRLCDGFHFPLGAVGGSDDARAQAGMCQSLCPGAPARVYVMQSGSERIEDAMSLDGRRYDRLPVAFRHASARDDTCSCRPAGASVGSPLMSLLDDLTLRRGDAIMTAKGVRVFRGATRWPLRQRDFVRVGDTKLSAGARAALATLDRLNARTQRARAAARDAAAQISPRSGVL